MSTSVRANATAPRSCAWTSVRPVSGATAVAMPRATSRTSSAARGSDACSSGPDMPRQSVGRARHASSELRPAAVRRGSLRGAALPADLAALGFVGAGPDALEAAVAEGELEALAAGRAELAHGAGGGGLLRPVAEERRGAEPATARAGHPAGLVRDEGVVVVHGNPWKQPIDRVRCSHPATARRSHRNVYPFIYRLTVPSRQGK